MDGDAADGPRPVESRFGAGFAELHPRLQALRRHGGQLQGSVIIDTGGLAVPIFLQQRTRRFKRIEGDRYRSHVSFALPWLGTVLAYSNLPEATALTPDCAPSPSTARSTR